MHDISRLQAWCYVTHRGKRFPKYHDKVVLKKTPVQSCNRKFLGFCDTICPVTI